ncbi:MAG TPA: hypothetical protein PLH19_08250 [Anaerolineae bacterium]|nr:hypothetical protein [Anaerolineae bacterium]HQH38505.1 hypothetical protein [Anaerolineae bacterium]
MTTAKLTRFKPWVGIGGLCGLHIIFLIVNFVRVPVTHGYDWAGHLTYLYYVAEYWQTPPAEVSSEFFNPPVYYFSVVAFQRALGLDLEQAGRVFNFVLALTTLGLMVGLCRRVWRDQIWPTLWWLGFYVCNPTVYRVFGMVRPEAMLMPLFTVAGWLVIGLRPQTRPWAWGFSSALLAGTAWGVRQWGIFLEVALLLWALMMCLQDYSVTHWFPWAVLGGQLIFFLGIAVFFLLLRGGHVLAFNAPPHPMNLTFLTRLQLPTLFVEPVRPALNYRFWPVLYADFWGDYWRYWREALGAVSVPTSPTTRIALSRAMWAALPATVLTMTGLLGLGRRMNEGMSAAGRNLSYFSRWLIGGSLGGFLIFASLYADPGEGDTVKSIYLVYLMPFCGYLGSIVVWHLTQPPFFRKGMGLVGLAMLLLLVWVAPNGIYLPPASGVGHSWVVPQVAYHLDVKFGNMITLVGYDWIEDASRSQLTLTLLWRADAYPGGSYKVFVHGVEAATGRVLAQSDTVPAGWTRPTQEWQIGEYIVDTHSLALSSEAISGVEIRVGLYSERTGHRLTTTRGGDYEVIVLQGQNEWDE